MCIIWSVTWDKLSLLHRESSQRVACHSLSWVHLSLIKLFRNFLYFTVIINPEVIFHINIIEIISNANNHRINSDQPDKYLQSLQKVFVEMKSSDVPVVVNTMGWNKGLGLQLLINTIHLVRFITIQFM